MNDHLTIYPVFFRERVGCDDGGADIRAQRRRHDARPAVAAGSGGVAAGHPSAVPTTRRLHGGASGRRGADRR